MVRRLRGDASHLLSSLLLGGALAVAFGLAHVTVSSVDAGEPKGPLSGFALQRTWSDMSGKFRVEATLEFADRTNVKLLKADGLSVTVPLDRLSQSDQRFVKGFLAAEESLSEGGDAGSSDADNPFAGGQPSGRIGRPTVPTAAAEMPAAALRPRFGGGEPDRSGSPSADPAEIPEKRAIVAGFRPISITPNAAFWETPPPRAFPEVTFREIVVQTALPKPFFAKMRVMAGGRTGTIVLNAYRQDRKPEENYSRFVVANASSGGYSDMISFDQPWKMMALSADGTRLAAVRVEGFDKGNDVAIFRIDQDRLVPEFRFTAGGGSWDEVQWVGFLPGNRLATISQKHDLTFWDLDNRLGAKTLFRGPTGGATTAEITAAGELMALIVGSSVAVIETGQGKMVGCITRDEPFNRIAFSPDGKTLAAFHPFSVTLYAMADGQEIRRIAVGEGNAQTGLAWVRKHLMVGSVVYDLERGMPLWTYESGSSGRAALGDYLISAFGRDNDSVANVIRIPHDEAIRSAQQVDPEAIFAIVPGDRVAVRYDFGATPAKSQADVRKALEAKIRDLGWTLADGGDNVIEIKIEQGDQEEVEYFERRGFGPIPFSPPPGFGGRPSGPSIKVQFRPWTHTVTITAGGQQVFRSAFKRSAPDNLRREDGESTQQAVLRICQPSPDYFFRLAIPPHLLKSEYQGGLGRSRIEPNGLR